LRALSAGQTVNAAKESAGLSWKVLYKAREDNSEFAKAWDEALEKCGRANTKARNISDAQRDIFLESISKGVNVNEAARLAGNNASSFYRKRERDASFSSLWESAELKSELLSQRNFREAEGRLFLDKVRAGKKIRESAKSLGKDPGFFYRARRVDPVFNLEWKAANLEAAALKGKITREEPELSEAESMGKERENSLFKEGVSKRGEPAEKSSFESEGFSSLFDTEDAEGRED
jgi:hypothetical protein